MKRFIRFWFKFWGWKYWPVIFVTPFAFVLIVIFHFSMWGMTKSILWTCLTIPVLLVILALFGVLAWCLAEGIDRLKAWSKND